MSVFTSRLSWLALALCLSVVAVMLAACGGDESQPPVLLRLSKPQRHLSGPLLPFPNHP